MTAAPDRIDRDRALGWAVLALVPLGLLLAFRRRRRPRTELTAAVTVNKTPQEVYDFWRGLERLRRQWRRKEDTR